MSGRLASIAVLCLFTVLPIFFELAKNIYKDKSSNEVANETNWLKDWHDDDSIKTVLNTTELGEGGVAANLDTYHMELYKEYGYDALLSDHISIHRSVPDVRPNGCKNITYLAQLPKAGIIIIFFNERLSVLLRTVNGIINRTPDELIQEIILVDDCSNYSELYNKLTEYLRTNLSTNRIKVRLVRLPHRSGLMVARMIGARTASKKSEVLIFLDAHLEVNYNWLPPLLEPIVINRKACTCPALDNISFKTFEYKLSSPYRGYFDWTLGYKFDGLYSHEYDTPAKNWREYVLVGGAIAIDAEFFWNLGGFDEGMLFWGGEQYELSFKIWMCGGEIIHVPCSRMAHLYRDPKTKGNTNLYGNYYFLDRNFRRVVEVWMDEEHRQYVFDRRPTVKIADPGDLTDRFAIRDRLNCKSFSWMIDNIMPDLKEKYPPIEPADLATGLLKSVRDPTLCIAITEDKKIILETCSINDTIRENMNWTYTWRGELRIFGHICLETNYTKGCVVSWNCHQTGGNQKWYLDRAMQWIVQKEYNKCMIANVDERLVKLDTCDPKNISMKWTISHMYQSEMDKWEKKFK